MGRLSALDVSFLTAETPTAHMHVGWVAVFDPPGEGRSRPGFEALRDHIAGRLDRATRYRQRLARVPLGVHRPVWVDDDDFDIDRHVLRAESRDLGEVVARAMSSQLERSRPLWECWIAERLSDGRIGVVGKVHHCMVDGLAAVELASLLVDPSPDPPSVVPDPRPPTPVPSGWRRLADGVTSRVGENLAALVAPVRLVSAPGGLPALARGARDAGAALADVVLRPAARVGSLNPPISAQRHVALLARPLEDLQAIRAGSPATLNDVVLAACTVGLRAFLHERGDDPPALKAMVPVSVREDGGAGEFGNRITFMFVPLPCDEPDALRALEAVHRETADRKSGGVVSGAETVVDALGRTPQAIQRVLARLVASPNTFNLVISNVRGPQVNLWMAGCPLREAYPIVPLAEQHALAIGVMTCNDQAFFGLYADRKALPDIDALAGHIDAAIDRLRADTAARARNGHRAGRSYLRPVGVH